MMEQEENVLQNFIEEKETYDMIEKDIYILNNIDTFFCIPYINMSEFIIQKDKKIKKIKKVSFNLNNNQYYELYITTDNEPPNINMTNVLFGLSALDKVKELNIGTGWRETLNLVTREFYLPLDKNGCGGNWEIFEKKINLIEEPDYSLIGLLWKQLNGFKKRNEE